MKELLLLLSSLAVVCSSSALAGSREQCPSFQRHRAHSTRRQEQKSQARRRQTEEPDWVPCDYYSSTGIASCD